MPVRSGMPEAHRKLEATLNRARQRMTAIIAAFTKL